MPNQEDINTQYELLAIHRRTLALSLRQQALGGIFTPPAVDHGIYEAREQIRRIKSILRDWGEVVEDHPDDEADANPQPAKPPTPQREPVSQQPDSRSTQSQAAHPAEHTLSDTTDVALIENSIARAFRLWNAQDEDARDTVVQMLEEIRQQAAGEAILRARFNAADRNERRLLRDWRLRDIAPDLAQYQHQWPPLQHRTQVVEQPEMADWLAANYLVCNPFGAGTAEFDPLLLRSRAHPDQWAAIFSTMSTLVRNGTHQDCVAVALILRHELQQPGVQPGVFPVPLMLPLAVEGQRNRERAVLQAIAQAAAETWMAILALNPAALLDLPEVAQIALAELLIWAIGSYDDLNLRLSLAGLAEDVEGRMLRRRLMRSPYAAGQIEPPSSSKLLNWLSVRPPGLLYTYLIARCRMATADARCQEQAIDLLNQVGELERRGVILKLFIPTLTETPPLGIDTVALGWTPQRLERMLSARMALASNNSRTAFRDLFGPMSVDPDRLLAAQAGGSLQTMLELGNRIIAEHLGRHLQGLEYQYLDEDDLDVVQAPATQLPSKQPDRADVRATVAPTAEPTIAIITALPHEYAAVKALLENQRGEMAPGSGAGWQYLLGDIPSVNGGRHSLVLSLAGVGTNIAAACATFLLTTFPKIDIILMVGIAGGVPHPTRPDHHVRLGDVVVSNQYGVVQYDFVKQVADKIEYRNPPRPPSAKFLRFADLLVAGEIEGQRPWMQFISPTLKRLRATRPSQDSDVLLDRSAPPQPVPHPPDRKRKRGQPRIFIGPIASGNKLLKSAYERDELRDQFGVKAVEMEGSGIADAAWSLEKNYFVVRGICDYSDENKNDTWQMYAAVAAAAYTRALLESIPG